MDPGAISLLFTFGCDGWTSADERSDYQLGDCGDLFPAPPLALPNTPPSSDIRAG